MAGVSKYPVRTGWRWPCQCKVHQSHKVGDDGEISMLLLLSTSFVGSIAMYVTWTVLMLSLMSRRMSCKGRVYVCA